MLTVEWLPGVHSYYKSIIAPWVVIKNVSSNGRGDVNCRAKAFGGNADCWLSVMYGKPTLRAYYVKQ